MYIGTYVKTNKIGSTYPNFINSYNKFEQS